MHTEALEESKVQHLVPLRREAVERRTAADRGATVALEHFPNNLVDLTCCHAPPPYAALLASTIRHVLAFPENKNLHRTMGHRYVYGLAGERSRESTFTMWSCAAGVSELRGLARVMSGLASRLASHQRIRVAMLERDETGS